jgi:hypothetical protein
MSGWRWAGLVVLGVCAVPQRALGQFLDPDTCWTCTDSFEHAAGGLLLTSGLQLVPRHWRTGWADTPGRRIVTVTVVGAVFELGQWDAARHTANAGQRGYGFGLKDLGCDLLGALVGEVVTGLLRHR